MIFKIGDEIQVDSSFYGKEYEGKTFTVNYVTSSKTAFTTVEGPAFSCAYARLAEREGLYDPEDWS